MRITVLILGSHAILASVLIVVLFFETRQLRTILEQAKVLQQASLERVHPIDTAGAPHLGPEFAPIIVVAFSGLEYRSCSDGPRVIPREDHSHALSAASASMAAHVQGLFWEFHTVLLEGREPLSPERYLEIAGEIGLDLVAFKEGMVEEQWRDFFEENRNQAIELKVSVTPTFFVNGLRVWGVDESRLRETILRIEPSLGVWR